MLLVGAGIICAILHRKRDAAAAQLVEITPMRTAVTTTTTKGDTCADACSSTGGYDMRPIEGLPVEAHATPIEVHAKP